MRSLFLYTGEYQYGSMYNGSVRLAADSDEIAFTLFQDYLLEHKKQIEKNNKELANNKKEHYMWQNPEVKFLSLKLDGAVILGN